jgi:6,7-dimethyl-8-ribityllumazine synthase
MQKNLSNIEALPDGSAFKVGIVCADWNESITSKLLEGCLDVLQQAGVPSDKIKIVHVPGSFELTSGAKILAASSKYDVIICLGCVIKGDTDHNQYINEAVANGLTQLGLISGIPFIFGLLTTLNYEQAVDRAGGTLGNKGIEAGVTALKMAQLKRAHSEPKKSIGY